MKKKVKKIIYSSKKIFKKVSEEVLESLLFVLWFTTPPYRNKIFSYPFGYDLNRQQLYKGIERLYRKGFIKKLRKRKTIFISPQVSPIRFILDNIEEIKLKTYNQQGKRWKGKWHLFFYDIPEKNKVRRDALRNFIKKLGFGKIQGSVWISPYDFSAYIYDFLQKEKILKYICFQQGNISAGESINKFVMRVWNLETIDDKYQQLISLCEENIEKIETSRLSSEDIYQRYFSLFKLYKDCLREDPFLPDGFLKNWKREIASRRIKKLIKVVLGEMKISFKNSNPFLMRSH